MRRWLIWIFAFLFVLSSTACTADITETRQDKVRNSLGKYESKQFWTHGAFQDYTDFGIYTYSEANLENNQYFKVVSEEDMEEIAAYLDNYEGWIDVHREKYPKEDLVMNYSFDRSIIDTSDYFYIFFKGESKSKFDNYDLWIFDAQTNKLYYFHTNI